jgi:hypothetical protein
MASVSSPIHLRLKGTRKNDEVFLQNNPHPFQLWFEESLFRQAPAKAFALQDSGLSPGLFSFYAIAL